MILGELLSGLDFECDRETDEYDVVSWYSDHIVDEYPLMTDEDIDGCIEISMECESVGDVKECIIIILTLQKN